MHFDWFARQRLPEAIIRFAKVCPDRIKKPSVTFDGVWRRWNRERERVHELMKKNFYPYGNMICCERMRWRIYIFPFSLSLTEEQVCSDDCELQRGKNGSASNVMPFSIFTMRCYDCYLMCELDTMSSASGEMWRNLSPKFSCSEFFWKGHKRKYTHD